MEQLLPVPCPAEKIILLSVDLPFLPTQSSSTVLTWSSGEFAKPYTLDLLVKQTFLCTLNSLCSHENSFVLPKAYD